MTNTPMTNPHRYQLQPYKGPISRYRCPQCKQAHVFTRYIDTETNRQLGDAVGRCSRQDNCSYHYTPKQHFANHPEAGVVNEYHPINLGKQYLNLSPSHISFDEVERSMSNYPDNNLFIWLSGLFGRTEALNLASLYHLGSSNHWHGATVFWQISAQSKVHTGKIMLYNERTGKRIKQPYNHIHWMHRKLYAGYYLQQCLFGEHLLPTDETKIVCLVESEKTALIAARYMPQYLWLATGGINNLNANVCKVLKGRTVILYPDVNACQLWQQKANDLELLLPNTVFKVSDYFERYATDVQRKEGWDLGDLLVG